MIRFNLALLAAVAFLALSDATVISHSVRHQSRGRELEEQAQYYSDYQNQINQYKYNYNNNNNGQQNYGQNDDAVQQQQQQQQQQGDDDQAAAAANFYGESDATDDTVYEDEANQEEEIATTDSSNNNRFKIDGSKWLQTKNAMEIYRMLTILFGSITIALLAYVWYLRRKLVPSSERLIRTPSNATEGTYQLDDTNTEAPPTVTIA